ncbi:MAG: sel1 repeat family protein [Acetobacteraceae bacterium]|nr:sel1 repeat family protein [Acetobacteraceae bacterium]
MPTTADVSENLPVAPHGDCESIMHPAMTALLMVFALIFGTVRAIAGPFEDGTVVHDAGRFQEARHLPIPLADQGEAGARVILGFMHRYGQGMPQNPAEAVTWYRQAADQGPTGARFNHGIMDRRSQGMPQSDAEAVMWYRQAAGRGQASAQLSLGVRYRRSQGMPQNPAEAVTWYRPLANP